MQRIANTSEKTQEILNEIKKDISTLVKMQDLKHDNLKQLKKTVDKLQKDIRNLENNDELSNYSNPEKDNRVLRTRLLMKKKNKSDSFSKWIFNNNER